MEVPNPMIRAYTSAIDESYKEEQAKLKKKKESNDAQAEILNPEIKELQQKSEHLLRRKALLDEEFVEAAKQAEIKGDMNLVAKAKALKKEVKSVLLIGKKT